MPAASLVTTPFILQSTQGRTKSDRFLSGGREGGRQRGACFNFDRVRFRRGREDAFLRPLMIGTRSDLWDLRSRLYAKMAYSKHPWATHKGWAIIQGLYQTVEGDGV